MVKYEPRRITIAGSRPNGVALDGENVGLAMGAVTESDDQLEIIWSSLDAAGLFRANLDTLLVSALQQKGSAASGHGPMYEIPVPVKAVSIQPDMLGQSIAIRLNSDTSYRVLWALEVSKVPELIAALQEALLKAQSKVAGRPS